MKLEDLLSEDLRARFLACHAAGGKIDVLERYKLTSDLLEEVGKLQYATKATMKVAGIDAASDDIFAETLRQLGKASVAGVETWAMDRDKLRREGRLPA